MSTYGIDIFDLGAATVNVAGIIEQDPSGAQWFWHVLSGPTFTLNVGAAPVHATISDTDAIPGNFGDDSEGQLTATDVTLNGTTYPAGSILMDEYEISLTDGIDTYRLVAVGYRDYLAPFVYLDKVVGFTFEGATPPEGVTLSFVVGSVQDFAAMVPCFSAGTMIDTDTGPRPVETLHPGCRLRAADGALHRLLWIGTQKVGAAELLARPNSRPVRIAAGALAPGVPETALTVSPQHRILLRSRIVAREHGGAVLAAARHLVDLPGVSTVADGSAIRYFHLYCAAHVILVANGAASESFYPGGQALKALSRRARQSFRAEVGPIGALPDPAFRFLSGRAARALVARHVRNGTALQLPDRTPCPPSPALPAPPQLSHGAPVVSAALPAPSARGG